MVLTLLSILSIACLGMAAWGTVRVLRAPEMEPRRRLPQLAVVWLVPFLGPALVVHLIDESRMLVRKPPNPNKPIHEEAWNETSVDVGAGHPGLHNDG
jgi:hypothetical protein